jgi:hypothetical protein
MTVLFDGLVIYCLVCHVSLLTFTERIKGTGKRLGGCNSYKLNTYIRIKKCGETME